MLVYFRNIQNIVFCIYQGWNIRSAAVVCQMMGLVVHPDEWNLPTLVPGDANQPIWRSQVKCTDLDMDVTKCQADGQHDHSCDHIQDVYVKCIDPTWAGKIVRILQCLSVSVTEIS